VFFSEHSAVTTAYYNYNYYDKNIEQARKRSSDRSLQEETLSL